MAKFRLQKNAFIAGEISPNALGRTDLAQYTMGCETLRNMIPNLSGGAYRRPGSILANFPIDADTSYAPRLIPFIYSKTEAYCLVLSKAVGGAGTLTYLKFGTYPLSYAIGTGAATGTAVLPYVIGSTNTTSTYSENHYDEIHEIQYAQSADIMWLVHPNRIPMRVVRTGTYATAAAFNWSYYYGSASGTSTPLNLRDSIPYRTQNTETTALMLLSAVTVGTGRTVTIDAGSTFTFTNNDGTLNAGHEGAYFKLNDGAGAYGLIKITAVASARSATCEVIIACGAGYAAGSGLSTWSESAWNEYRGYPRTVAIFKNRLVYGGNKAEPDTLWFSETGDYSQMSVSTITDPYGAPTGAEPFSATLNSTQLNPIQWLIADETLTVGTAGDEWIISQPSTATSFTNVYKTTAWQSKNGSAYHQAIKVGSAVLFAKPSNDEIKTLVFNDTEQAYVTEPIQTLFDHYPKANMTNTACIYSSFRKYRRFAWDESRKTLWCCDIAGNLFALTMDRKLGVFCWTSHQMGGYSASNTGGTVGTGNDTTLDPAYYACSGSVISLCVVPNSLGGDDVFLAVKRKINGSYEYHIEAIIGGQIAKETAYLASTTYDAYNPSYVDAAVFESHLSSDDNDIANGFEGETLEGVAYNSKGIFKVETNAVTAGVVTVQPNYPGGWTTETTGVYLGLPFQSYIKPLRPDAGSVIGSAQGALKRIHQVTVRFVKTIAAKVGRDTDNLDTIQFRLGSTPMSKSPELFTGDKTVEFNGDYDRDGYLVIMQDQPLPFAVASISETGQTYD